MPRYKLVITDFITGPLDTEREVLGDMADVVALNAFSEDELVGKIEDADAVMLYHNLGLTRKTIARLTRCKLIVRCGVGYDNVDRAFARERGIPVSNVPDYGTEDVADTAIGMMLTLTRGIHFLNSKLRDADDPGPWSYTQIQPVYRLNGGGASPRVGRVFAIVGLGRIGIAAALRAKALGMDVAFYDPLRADGYDKAIGIRRVETLDELLAQAHVLSLHCPLTEQTRNMINAGTIAKMPRGSYLINTARGAVVDTSAIPAAIAAGHLAGAGIDVLEEEPPSAIHPLIVAWRAPNHPAHHRVIINPHSAFYSEEGLRDMRVKGSEACKRAIRGLDVRNVVN